jgi:dipeptidyl-peptidase-3
MTLVERPIGRPRPAVTVGVAALAAVVGCQQGGEPGHQPAGARTGPIETVGTTAIVSLELPGWTELTAQERVLTYHLCRAAIAGREMFWNQKHPAGSELLRLANGLARGASRIPEPTRQGVLDWAKTVYLNNGIHHDRTKMKLVPGVSREEFRAAVEQAGVAPPEGLTLAAWLASLEPLLFDPEVDPLVVRKEPGPGGDMLRDSAVNYYDGVTLPEVERFAAEGLEHHPLNSRLVKEDGRLVEQVWRVGDPERGIPRALYATEIERILVHLGRALPHAPPKTRQALERLIRFYRTGDPEDWKAYNIAWVQADDGPVDTINGFIEVYLDPRGQKGAFEGVVHYVDRRTNELMRALGQNAQYFEDRAPFDDAWKRTNLRVPVARAVNVAIAVGDGGPQTSIGINLPNDNRVRAEYGSKSVTLANVIAAYQSASLQVVTEEFVPQDEREAARRHGADVMFLQTSMHEVLGHASGKVSDSLKGDPSEHLRETYSALEEARAELLALHHSQDPKLLELGAFKDPAAAEESLRAYARAALVQLRRVKTGDRFEDDHMRAIHLIVGWLARETGAVAFANEGGKTYVRVKDLAAMREGVARLTREIQRIKATGDYPAAKALVETYAIRFDPALRDEVVERAARAGVPDFYGALMPHLVPVRDAQGGIVDVELGPPESFLGQMLRFADEAAE